MKNVTKQIWKIPSLILLMLFCCLTASAQQFTAKGIVVDGNGEPVIGASVVLKGNNSVGTITDIDGNFELNVPNDAVLVVSFVGMQTKEVKASSSLMKIDLVDDSQQLEEGVVVGYGQQKRLL